ncbi:lecithin:retinol acyltransferase [Paraburkholderia sp. BL6669N2]|uniref:lecithin retinol acyltransferase family protein n=1 Tax=Paraburkholderia sp. BL6669N2 TaxID=1938807 RepID=UPI000E383647|nr:lecithin retinol acyltransferase family protein [Paraburkholderia sp. BL6669N2]REG50903.1 lecithin:retinol acyltransferase [Paraburkholderia sp. BL6669N2]
MSIWDSIADAFGGIKDAVETFPEIMKDPYAVSIGHVKTPKLSMTKTLSKGAVIKVSRCLGLYDHYGIYISDSAVVHFSNDEKGTGELSSNANRIIKGTLKEFMDGAQFFLPKRMSGATEGGLAWNRLKRTGTVRPHALIAFRRATLPVDPTAVRS